MSASDDIKDEVAGAVGQLFAALRGRDGRALARAVSLVEDGASEAEDLLALCRAAIQNDIENDRANGGRGGRRALRMGITGPAGAGKSTLVDALTRELRKQGRRVGIVAVDPSSHFSRGAILGDRIRVEESGLDAGVYMRSMATRGHLGGLARATDDVLAVIEAGLFAGESDSGGRDVLLLETTGVGQGEIEVAGLADVVAVVLVPGMGDSVQSMKAGLLEIASVFVLNKADREGIDRLEGEIGEMLALSGPDQQGTAVVRTVATEGKGVRELLAIVDGLAEGIWSDGRRGGLTARVGLRAGSLNALVPGAAIVPGAVLDHIGIAVRSIAASSGIYAALQVPISAVEEVAQERVRVAMVSLGASRIEMLEGTADDSVVSRFVAKRGEGIHHVALQVADLSGVVKKLKEQGIRLVSEVIQVGAGGHRYVFIHPSSACGVLLELVESEGAAGGEGI